MPVGNWYDWATVPDEDVTAPDLDEALLADYFTEVREDV